MPRSKRKSIGVQSCHSRLLCITSGTYGFFCRRLFDLGIRLAVADIVFSTMSNALSQIPVHGQQVDLHAEFWRSRCHVPPKTPGVRVLERIAEFWRETGYGMRLCRKNPGFTLIVTITLGLGIGATTAIFSVLYATVLAPLPFFEPERLVMIESKGADGRNRIFAPDRVETWRAQSKTLESVSYALNNQVNATLTTPNGAERVRLEQVDFHTFEVLGIKPILGRWFQSDEVIVQGNTAQTTVISYGLWQRLFGGDPNVIGKKLPGWTAGWGEVVIGVMPKGFYTHPTRINTDAWYVITRNPGLTVGRLRPGIRPEQAQAELAALGRQDPPPNSPQNPDNTYTFQLTPLHQSYREQYAHTLYMLLGSVGFVLLIASVNVANLQLNRGAKRQPEMATRVALGAGRFALFRQLVIENVTLTLVGGVLGLLIAREGISLFVLLAPDFYPPSEEIKVNGPVLLFTLGVCLTTGILSGLVPGLRGSNPDLSTSLKEAGRGTVGQIRLGMRRALVVTEVALATILLIGAGLMINSYARLTSVDVGLNPDKVVSMEVNLFGMDKFRVRRAPNQWTAKPAISEFYTNALRRLALLPGVESAATTSNLPPSFRGQPVAFKIIGKPTAGGSDAPRTAYHEISPAYFQTLRIPLLRGRAFTDSDNETGPGVAIISDTLARQYFGDENPVGQSVQALMNRSNPTLEGDRVREIVGVVRDVRMGLKSEFGPIMYVPYRQNLTDYESNFSLVTHAIQNFVVRTSNDPATLLPTVRRAIAEVDPSVAVIDIMPMRTRLSLQAGNEEFWMRLLGIFAGLGMFLAAIGVYGVISYAVEQRTHEFGVRTALGARESDILRLVLREGFLVIAIGLTIGIGGAYGATRLIANQLYGVKPMDPTTIAAVALVLTLVAFLACYIPGRRASKLDPLTALRME
jgi:putative ABC transport system permease protein